MSELDNNIADKGVQDVSQALDDAGKVDMIYEALLASSDGTKLTQDYLSLKSQAENSIGNVKILSDVNEDLRKTNAKLNLEIRETRRLLDGRHPMIVEVEKKVSQQAQQVQQPAKPTIKEPTIEDIKAFFEG